MQVRHSQEREKRLEIAIETENAIRLFTTEILPFNVLFFVLHLDILFILEKGKNFHVVLTCLDVKLYIFLCLFSCFLHR